MSWCGCINVMLAVVSPCVLLAVWKPRQEALSPGEEGEEFLWMVETFRPGLSLSGRDEKFSTILSMLC